MEPWRFQFLIYISFITLIILKTIIIIANYYICLDFLAYYTVNMGRASRKPSGSGPGFNSGNGGPNPGGGGGGPNQNNEALVRAVVSSSDNNNQKPMTSEASHVDESSRDVFYTDPLTGALITRNWVGVCWVHVTPVMRADNEYYDS